MNKVFLVISDYGYAFTNHKNVEAVCNNYETAVEEAIAILKFVKEAYSYIDFDKDEEYFDDGMSYMMVNKDAGFHCIIDIVEKQILTRK